MPNIQFQFRRGTAAEWDDANPTLAAGEVGIDTDTNRFKIGNGDDAWVDLPYGGLESSEVGVDFVWSTVGSDVSISSLPEGSRQVRRRDSLLPFGQYEWLPTNQSVEWAFEGFGLVMFEQLLQSRTPSIQAPLATMYLYNHRIGETDVLQVLQMFPFNTYQSHPDVADDENAVIIQANPSFEPSIGSWQDGDRITAFVTINGEKGETGSGFPFRYIWNSSTAPYNSQSLLPSGQIRRRESTIDENHPFEWALSLSTASLIQNEGMYKTFQNFKFYDSPNSAPVALVTMYNLTRDAYLNLHPYIIRSEQEDVPPYPNEFAGYLVNADISSFSQGPYPWDSWEDGDVIELMIHPTGNQGPQGEPGTNGTNGTNGAPGEQGPQGQPGATNRYFPYQANANDTTGDPGTHKIVWNNATQTDATQLNVRNVDQDGFDAAQFLMNLVEDDVLRIQAKGSAADFQEWTVTAAPTQETGYITIPVVLATSGGTDIFGNNGDLALVITGAAQFDGDLLGNTLRDTVEGRVNVLPGITVEAQNDVDILRSAVQVDYTVAANVAILRSGGFGMRQENGATAPSQIASKGYDVGSIIDPTSSLTYDSTGAESAVYSGIFARFNGLVDMENPATPTQDRFQATGFAYYDSNAAAWRFALMLNDFLERGSIRIVNNGFYHDDVFIQDAVPSSRQDFHKVFTVFSNGSTIVPRSWYVNNGLNGPAFGGILRNIMVRISDNAGIATAAFANNGIYGDAFGRSYDGPGGWQGHHVNQGRGDNWEMNIWFEIKSTADQAEVTITNLIPANDSVYLSGGAALNTSFVSVPAWYDDTTRTATLTRPASGTRFYRLKWQRLNDSYFVKEWETFDV